MNATITSLGGRAPPGRKTPPLSSGSRWRVSVRRLPAGVASAPRAPAWSGPAGCRHRAPPAAPSGATIPCESRVSRRRTESPPIATDARGRGRRPSGRHARVPRENAYWVVPWAPSSLGKSPPINPVRFSEALVTNSGGQLVSSTLRRENCRMTLSDRYQPPGVTFERTLSFDARGRLVLVLEHRPIPGD